MGGEICQKMVYLFYCFVTLAILSQFAYKQIIRGVYERRSYSHICACFFMDVPNWNFEKLKKIHIWPKFLKRRYFPLKLGKATNFRFYIFLLFLKSTSGAVIPRDVDLHFCTWQAHFCSNVRDSFKIYILNKTNLCKYFKEHFFEHFRCHIFQIKILEKIVSFIR